MSPNQESNPLLEIQFRIPFDRIRAADVEPAVEELLRDAREKLECLAADPSPRTFENTMLAFEAITERLEYAMTVVRHLESVATYPELRAAFNAVQPAVSEFESNILLHEGLWKTIQRYEATTEAKNLTGTRRRFLEKTVDDFKRHGAGLDLAGKARLAEIDVELSKQTTLFSEHVLDSTNAFELIITDESKLAGLPESAIAAAKQSADAKGVAGWRFTLQAPSYLALMTYLDDRAIRQQVYHAYNVRATSGNSDNREIVSWILELRREKAKLLGFADFADLVIDDRMAHTGARAQEFLNNLRAKTEAAFNRENDNLREFRRRIEGRGAPELELWDIAYYAEKQRAALYDFDQEALRPYFPLAKVVEGMFSITGRLFGIVVKPETGVSVWDPKVSYYTIHDEADSA